MPQRFLIYEKKRKNQQTTNDEHFLIEFYKTQDSREKKPEFINIYLGLEMSDSLQV